MKQLSKDFKERLEEVNTYLEFLENIDKAIKSGTPKLKINNSEALITSQQQHILYSAVFLQLYNLVEASITQCLTGLTQTALQEGKWTPKDFTSAFRGEWVRAKIRPHVDMSHNNRLNQALVFCEHIVEALPVLGFDIESGGGNWDDIAIEKIANRIGFNLQVSEKTNTEVKYKIKDGLGSLALIKKLRNNLAHGNISFAECGRDHTVEDLRDITNRTAKYMCEVVNAFESYIDKYGFLASEKPSEQGRV